MANHVITNEAPQELNAQLNLWSYDENGNKYINFDADTEAARQYFLQEVNSSTRFFYSLKEKLEFLFANLYYEPEVWTQYGITLADDGSIVEDDKFERVKDLYRLVYAYKHRFKTYMGALKFNKQYALKSFDGKSYLERYEDRVVATSLLLARGDMDLAVDVARSIMEGRFQPATPTFGNAGKAQRGELVSCFEGHTPILTENGPVPISEVAVGDLVYTHDGSLKEVTDTMSRKEHEGLVTLTITGQVSKFSATKEHPVLVMPKAGREVNQVIDGDGATDNVKWISVSDVVPGDFIAVSVPDRYTDTVQEIRVSDYVSSPDSWGRVPVVEGDNTIRRPTKDKKNNKKKGTDKSGQSSSINNTIPLNYDFGRFVGYYLSEGYVHKSRGTIKGPRFTFNTLEESYQSDVSYLASTLFGVDTKINVNKDGSSNVVAWNRILGEFLTELIGTGFDKKILPDVLMDAPDEFLRGVLVGTFRGDGSVIGRHAEVTLSNPALVSQLRTIMLRVGLICGERTFLNRVGTPTSTLRVPMATQDNINFIHEIDKDRQRIIGTVTTDRYQSMKIVDGYFLFKVRSTEIEEKETTVYNLEVADNHTYVASGVIAHNCFLSLVNDDMESISKSVSTALQLSKRGGGVALNLSDIRESGAPIKNIEGQSSGVVPVMKILEDSFSYADQLGQRKGSGAVYLSVHHPDIEKFLDTKRENADEKIRIKTLSLGVVITDAMMTAARKGEDLYLFSPYSIMREYGKPLSQISISDHYEEMINNPKIRKSKVSARKLLQRIAEIQFESGYPYVMFEDTVNRANAIDGRVSFSNLCSEILQVSEPATFNDRGEYDYEGRDISCNLGSMNIDNVMKSGQLEYTVDTAIRALTSVSDLSDLRIVPPIRRGNELSHAVGLGQMSLASYFLRMGWQYGSPISVEFTNAYFMAVSYYAYKTSNMIAMERGETFYEFEKSKYADPAYLTQKYSDPENIEFHDEIRSLFSESGIDLPTSEDWAVLAESIAEHGLYNAYLQAVPPTGSISYINNASASIHPFTDAVETRKEGMTGRVYYPQPNVTSENFHLAENAYDVGYKKLIDVYAEATKHVDQGLSLTLFFRDTATTADINKAQLYAYKKGIKTLYYVRLAKSTLSGTEFSECVSCAL